MAEILERGGPAREGITLTDRYVRFSDLYRMTEKLDIEFGLAREIVDGKRVYRLYSGGKNAVTIPSKGVGVRNIAHTHPSGSRYPSTGAGNDMSNINSQFLDLLESDPLARFLIVELFGDRDRLTARSITLTY